MNIVEVGSGTGVFSDSFLEYFKFADFSKYKKCNY
jgi:phospholipid N-methyltransferase